MASKSKHSKESYDWLNDPFDEKKAAKEREQAHLSSSSKALMGVGCVVVVVVVVVLAFLLLGSLAFAG